MDILDAFEKIQRDAGTEHGIMINDLYRTNRYWTLLDELNKRLNKLGEEQLIITEQSLIDTYRLAQETIEKIVPKELVRTSFLVPNAMRAEDVVRQCWVLDGKEFSDRI